MSAPVEPLKMTLELYGGRGSIIPSGTRETLTIFIINEIASFTFKNEKTTEKFSQTQLADGVKSVYNPLQKKTYCYYKGMSRDAIAAHLKDRLAELKKKDEVNRGR